MTRSHGADFSRWELKTIDFSQARQVIDFAFIKVSEGTVLDPLFRAQWAAAKGYILRSGYHYFRPSIDPGAAARMFSEYMGSDGGEIPPALDLETTDGRPDTLERARIWLETFEAKTDIRPIVYSSPGFLNYVKAANYPFLRRYRFWIAQYYYDNWSDEDRARRLAAILSGEYVPPFPGPVAPWLEGPEFWQYTAIGDPEALPGYYTGTGSKKEVDFNLYKGTREELLLSYGKPSGTLPNNGDSSMPYQYSITPLASEGLKVRSNHFVVNYPTSNQIASLPFGRLAYGNEKWTATVPGTGYAVGDTWLRVLSVDGSPVDGWIAEIHQGSHVGKLDTLQQTQTPTQGLEATVVTTISSPGYKSQTVTNKVILEPE